MNRNSFLIPQRNPAAVHRHDAGHAPESSRPVARIRFTREQGFKVQDKLDDLTQGQLFFDDQVKNRKVRIAFACSTENVIYMREAAGGRNVWMDDEEFADLVELNDSVTFACFARSEQMKPHHLLFIVQKLAANPHSHEFLANSYEAKITLMKALEVQGNTPELSCMRQAVEAVVNGSGQTDVNTGQDISGLWQSYLNIRNASGCPSPRKPESLRTK
jgi:hypothetical protein